MSAREVGLSIGITVLLAVTALALFTGYRAKQDKAADVGTVLMLVGITALGIQLSLLRRISRSALKRRPTSPIQLRRPRIVYLALLILLVPIQYSCFHHAAASFAAVKVRRCIARDRAELESIAKAVKSYSIDLSWFPSDLDQLTRKITFDPAVPGTNAKLCTEIPAYLPGHLFRSGFGKALPIEYASLPLASWIAWSPGPDEDFDIVHGKELDAAL
jgi:hypothetical protein